MLDKIKGLLGMGPKTDYAQLIKRGGIILDVRSAAEFNSGHIKAAVNIPVDQLRHQLHKIKDKQKPVITCCASGMRSASAKNILLSNGFAQVYNGGGWSSLQNKL